MMTITFEPGGRFRETGLLRYTAWAAMAPDGEDRKAVEGGAGSYSIQRGGGLELRYESGPVARFFLATPPAVSAGMSPTSLHLGGARLARAP